MKVRVALAAGICTLGILGGTAGCGGASQTSSVTNARTFMEGYGWTHVSTKFLVSTATIPGNFSSTPWTEANIGWAYANKLSAGAGLPLSALANRHVLVLTYAAERAGKAWLIHIVDSRGSIAGVWATRSPDLFFGEQITGLSPDKAHWLADLGRSELNRRPWVHSTLGSARTIASRFVSSLNVRSMRLTYYIAPSLLARSWIVSRPTPFWRGFFPAVNEMYTLAGSARGPRGVCFDVADVGGKKVRMSFTETQPRTGHWEVATVNRHRCDSLTH